MYEIRSIKDDDLLDIESIVEQSFENEYIRSGYIEELKYLAKHDIVDYILTASTKLEVVGFIHGTDYVDCGEVDYLVVDKDYRKEGIGTLLLKELGKKFLEDNFENMRLVPTPTSEQFYRKLGFRHTNNYKMMIRINQLLSPDTYL